MFDVCVGVAWFCVFVLTCCNVCLFDVFVGLGVCCSLFVVGLCVNSVG